MKAVCLLGAAALAASLFAAGAGASAATTAAPTAPPTVSTSHVDSPALVQQAVLEHMGPTHSVADMEHGWCKQVTGAMEHRALARLPDYEQKGEHLAFTLERRRWGCSRWPDTK